MAVFPCLYYNLTSDIHLQTLLGSKLMERNQIINIIENFLRYRLTWGLKYYINTEY